MYTAIDERQMTAIIALDISAAFDTINYKRQRVFVVDLRLPRRRCQLDEVEQVPVKLTKRLKSCGVQ